MDGLVADSLSLGLDGLRHDFSVVEQHSVLTCVSNEVGGALVGSSLWTGVPLRDVIDAAGPTPAATTVLFECADGYTAAVPLSAARDRSALVAIGQGRAPLRPEHGFPCRVRLPPLYGMLDAKWVQTIRLLDRPLRGYWAQRGWSPTGIVRRQSRIDTRADVQAGRATWIAGVAWAGTRGVAAVEVSTDGGRTWHRARPRPPLSPLAWTQWAYRWLPERRGDYKVLCRATDGRGALQDERRRPPHPSGASGWHTITLRAS